MQEIYQRWERTVGIDTLLSTGHHGGHEEKCSEVTFNVIDTS